MHRTDAERARRWRANNPERIRRYERAGRRRAGKRNNHLRRRYGISIEERDAMLERQRGCGGCRRVTPTKRGWFVDHDHKTRKVRGILCHPCNTALGMVRDNPATLRRLFHYLAK